MGYESTFLFATPSFREGVGRLVDFGNSLTQYNASSSPVLADFRALRNDWRAVGSDLSLAIAGEVVDDSAQLEFFGVADSAV